MTPHECVPNTFMYFLCTRFDGDVWVASALFDVYNSLHQSVAVCWLIANGKRNRNQPFITSYNKTPTEPCRLTFLQINQIIQFFVLDLRQTKKCTSTIRFQAKNKRITFYILQVKREKGHLLSQKTIWAISTHFKLFLIQIYYSIFVFALEIIYLYTVIVMQRLVQGFAVKRKDF